MGSWLSAGRTALIFEAAGSGSHPSAGVPIVQQSWLADCITVWVFWNALTWHVLQAKCTLGDETRLLHIGPNVTYAEMLEGVRAKFPDAPPFALKFLDRCTGVVHGASWST